MQVEKIELLEEQNGEFSVLVQLTDSSMEFAEELGQGDGQQQKSFVVLIKRVVRERYPDLRVTMVKVMVSGMIITAIPMTSGKTASASSGEDRERTFSIPTEIHKPLAFNPNSGSEPVVRSQSAAANGPRILLDNRMLSTEAVIINGSTFVPIRAVSESLGAAVGWNHQTKTVTIVQSDAQMSFVVGSTVANVNGQNVVTPASFILNGTTMVPLRFVSETLGLGVVWDAGSRTVILTSSQPDMYTVQSGDSLWTIAGRHGTTVDALKSANQLTSDVLYVGQRLIVSTSHTVPVPPPTTEPATVTYTVVAGDTLSAIASRYGTSVQAIRNANQLTTDILMIGQRLTIPSVTGASPSPVAPATGGVTVTYVNHTVRSGDNIWNLSVQYGVPHNELMQVNQLNDRSVLQIGQTLRVPVYNVPIRPAVSARHGEVLDWWTEGRYVYSIGKVATITDFQTGQTFQVRRTMGGNHADSEPLTARDTQIMREIWGGNFSWTPRAIIVEVDGRRLAAAMHSMPHGDQVIRDNQYSGHFCIHFLNSQRHNDGLIQDSMQQQIEIAAGRKLR